MKFAEVVREYEFIADTQANFAEIVREYEFVPFDLWSVAGVVLEYEIVLPEPTPPSGIGLQGYDTQGSAGTLQGYNLQGGLRRGRLAPRG